MFAVIALFLTVGLARGADLIDDEMLPLIEKIVGEADDGRAIDTAKAGALRLIGELHLIECRSILEDNINWRYKPAVKSIDEAIVLTEGRYPLAGQRGYDLSRMADNDAVTVLDAPRAADLSLYPQLNSALDAFSTNSIEDRDEVVEAYKQVLRWYEVVCRSLRSIIERRRNEVYDDKAKIASIWLMGEYRDVSGMEYLAENIDLRDASSLSATFSGRLQVSGFSSEFPAETALMKIGPSAKERLERMAASPGSKISAEGAERLRQLANRMAE
jgi:hypothetical protein